MKFTNEMLQDSLTLAYERIFSAAPQADLTRPVNQSGDAIATQIAHTAAQRLLQSIPEENLESAIAAWNAEENRWTRQYIIARMAERANDESYSEEYRKELRQAIGRLPLGVDGMNIDPL